MAKYNAGQIQKIKGGIFREYDNLLQDQVSDLMVKVNELDDEIPSGGTADAADVAFEIPEGSIWEAGDDDVQAAIERIATVLGAVDAAGIPFGCESIEATDVQAAIEEVDGDVTELAGLVFMPKVSSILDGSMIPAEPADGFRVFCTGDSGSFVEGKIYEYSTADGWDSGTNLSAGRAVTSVDGDIIVGGNGLQAYQEIGETDDADEISYDNEASDLTATDVQGAIDEIVRYAYDVTVLNTALSGSSTPADASLIGGNITSIVPISGVESYVAGSAIDGTGVITLTMGSAQSSGNAEFKVYCQKVPVA
jgi:hypothetical protein